MAREFFNATILKIIYSSSINGLNDGNVLRRLRGERHHGCLLRLGEEQAVASHQRVKENY